MLIQDGAACPHQTSVNLIEIEYAFEISFSKSPGFSIIYGVPEIGIQSKLLQKKYFGFIYISVIALEAKPIFFMSA